MKVIYILFLCIHSINCNKCNLFINNANHTDSTTFYLNNTSILNIKYQMENNYIEAYKIKIICNFVNFNKSLLVNRNFSTIRGIVMIEKCTQNLTFDLDLPNLDEHYDSMNFNGDFSLFKIAKSNSFDENYISVSSKMIGISSVCSNTIWFKNGSGVNKNSLYDIFEHFINKIKAFEPTYFIILFILLFIFVVIIGLITYFLCKYFKHKRKNVFISNTLNRLITGKNTSDYFDTGNDKVCNGTKENCCEDDVDIQNVVPKRRFKKRARTFSAPSCFDDRKFTSNPKIPSEFIFNGKNYKDGNVEENIEDKQIKTFNMCFVPNVIFELKQIPSKI
jgi:hypothetical protein